MPRDIDEGPSDADIARFGGDETTCPECGAEVYYDAAFCHECGHVMEDRMTGAPKLWLTLAAGMGLVAFALVYAFR